MPFPLVIELETRSNGSGPALFTHQNNRVKPKDINRHEQRQEKKGKQVEGGMKVWAEG
jgi:hypothetical protein